MTTPTTTGFRVSFPVTPSGVRFAAEVDGWRYGRVRTLGVTLGVEFPPWRKARDAENAEQHERVKALGGRPTSLEPPDSGRLLGLSVLKGD